MKSKTQDKKRLNAVGMRICALFAVLAVVFAAFMTTVPHALASETGDPSAVKGKTYAVGTDTTFAPFEYRENGKMTGIDMELIRGIAKEEGFKVEIQSLGFNAALQALSSNQVDVVIAGMSITDERKASYDFSNPYFQSGIQMAVAANNDDVTGYYGEATRTAVKKFQKQQGIQQTGTAGPQTLKALGISVGSLPAATESNVYLLARIISAEARGEPYTGQVAVGAVILNRIEHPSFPDTLSGVIYQNGAFTAIVDGQFNEPIAESAYSAARDALNGWDPTGGCVYYYNPAKTSNKFMWSRPTVLTIGSHRFCN